MKRFEGKNEALDRTGSELLEASMLTSDEIEKIVTVPHLFDPVRAAIRSERKIERPVSVWRKPAMAFAAVTVFVIGAFGLMSFAKQYYVSSDAVLNAQNRVEPIVIPQPVQIIEPRIEYYGTQNPTVVKTVARQSNKSKSAVVRTVKKELPNRRIEEVSDFYAVTYTGDTDESDDDQIVRVELPRSSLFAMGINVPVENEVFKVKADLLIGSDGVMKAVRLVR